MKDTHIPGVQSPRWFTRQWVGELVGAFPPLIPLVVSAYVLLSDRSKPRWLGLLPIVGAMWLVIASVLKIARAKSEDDQKAQQGSPEGLAGCVHVLYNILAARLQLGDTQDGRLRITVHRVVPATKASPQSEPLELEQVLPYIGGEGGPAGRRFSKRAGIAGYVMRERAAFAVRRRSDDYEAFVVEMVQTWGYTRDEARRLSADRQAWMGVPLRIAEDRDVIGVVFLDSRDRDIFQDETVTRLIIAACYGITQYIKERY